MKSLGEIQYSELLHAIQIGYVDIANVVVVGSTVCEKKGDALIRHIPCASEHGAGVVRAILAREAGCEGC